MVRTVKFFIISFVFLLILSFPVFSFGVETFQLTDYDGDRFRVTNILDPDINANGEVIWIRDDAWVRRNDVFLYDSQGNIRSLTEGLSNIPRGSLRAPKLNDLGQAVWIGDPPSSSPEIFLGSDPIFYNGQTINRLRNEPIIKNYDPLINNKGQIVWTGITGTDNINGSSYYHSEIFSYDGNSTKQLTSGKALANSYTPALSDTGYITWVTKNTPFLPIENTDIYLYHDGVTQRITNDSNFDIAPQVNSKGEVAWLTLSDSDAGINFYDGTEIKHLVVQRFRSS